MDTHLIAAPLPEHRIQLTMSWWISWLKMTTWKENRVLLHIMNRACFFQHPGSGLADQANWTPCLCLHGPKTFSRARISLKTSIQMHQTDSLSLSPATHIGTPSPGTISTGLVWYLLMIHYLPAWSPVSWMKQCTSLSTARRNIRARSLQFYGLTLDSSANIMQMQPVLMVPVWCLCACVGLSICLNVLGDIELLPNAFVFQKSQIG